MWPGISPPCRASKVVKALTLGASSWQLLLRVALPQAMPRLIQALRLSLGPAWVFLISAEAIAADVGLGYRIFLVRRYLAMDVILALCRVDRAAGRCHRLFPDPHQPRPVRLGAQRRVTEPC